MVPRQYVALKILDLETNNLTGTFPRDIFNLSFITDIAISVNHISGILPMNLCKHCPNLHGLYISYNEFSGKLPSQFNHCRELLILSLSDNKFDGSIPKGFGSSGKLEILGLAGNNFTGNL